MSADGDVDTSRTSVSTTVPAYQKEEWADHADQLGMSLSEFVRSMVQAGRRGFSGSEGSSEDTQPETPAGGDLEARVVSALQDEEVLSWDELIEAVTDDVEAKLDETLQESGAVRYSGRDGGYVLEGS